MSCSGRRGEARGRNIQLAFLCVPTPSHVAVVGCRAAMLLQACSMRGEEESTDTKSTVWTGVTGLQWLQGGKLKKGRKAGGKETLLADPKAKCNFFFTKTPSLWLGYCSKHRKAVFLQLTTLKSFSLMHEWNKPLGACSPKGRQHP